MLPGKPTTPTLGPKAASGEPPLFGLPPKPAPTQLFSPSAPPGTYFQTPSILRNSQANQANNSQQGQMGGASPQTLPGPSFPSYTKQPQSTYQAHFIPGGMFGQPKEGSKITPPTASKLFSGQNQGNVGVPKSPESQTSKIFGNSSGPTQNVPGAIGQLPVPSKPFTPKRSKNMKLSASEFVKCIAVSAEFEGFSKEELRISYIQSHPQQPKINSSFTPQGTSRGMALGQTLPPLKGSPITATNFNPSGPSPSSPQQPTYSPPAQQQPVLQTTFGQTNLQVGQRTQQPHHFQHNFPAQQVVPKENAILGSSENDPVLQRYLQQQLACQKYKNPHQPHISDPSLQHSSSQDNNRPIHEQIHQASSHFAAALNDLIAHINHPSSGIGQNYTVMYATQADSARTEEERMIEGRSEGRKRRKPEISVYVFDQQPSTKTEQHPKIEAERKQREQFEASLPIFGQFSTFPELGRLRKYTPLQLSSVARFEVWNEFGSIQFQEPVSLVGVNLQRDLRITQDCIEITDRTLQSKKFIMSFNNFGNYLSLGPHERWRLMKDVRAWMAGCGLKLLYHDPVEGRLVVTPQPK